LTSALNGTKVLDLTGMGPASIAAMMLGDMGADVIKISMPPKAGDRGVGGGIDFDELPERPAFDLECLRNKRNLALNLKTEAGRDLFYKLAETADIIIESFRPGVMDRLGVGYDTVAKKNPGIIFCSVSGYGQNGPYRNLPGHDANYAGMGGALGLVGNSKDEPPVMAQNTYADMTGAILQAVIGILSAICARGNTGKGQWVDISMTDSVVFTLSTIPEVSEYLLRGTVASRGETIFGGTQPWYSVYRTADDKYLSLCPLEPHFWGNLCKALDREDLIVCLYDMGPRMEELYEELRGIFRTKTRDEWFELLSKADVPMGKVQDIDEVFSDPHVRHRQMVIEVDHPQYGKVKQIGFPVKLSDTPWKVRIPVALMGEHTGEVLSELGYSEDEINKLREEGVIY
jgi:crotonobetainyl-CoA:carnitine CoA-transferase CaiB-like acyl-CoA transferase